MHLFLELNEQISNPVHSAVHNPVSTHGKNGKESFDIGKDIVISRCSNI